MKRITMKDIILDPNPILREEAKEVELPLSETDRKTLEAMLEYVRNSQDDEIAEELSLQPAVGIAAPQLGISKRMLVVVVDTINRHDEVETIEYALVNPKIISHSVKEAALATGEGCLSVKEIHEGYVPRPKRVRIQGYDLIRDKMVDFRAKDHLAIVLQHEIDHLEGILFYDRIDQENPWAIKDDLDILE